MYSQGRSKLSIAAQAGVSRNTAKKYLAAFDASGCTFEEINALNDKELEDFFGNSYERPPDKRMLSLQRCFPQVDKELKRTGMNRRIQPFDAQSRAALMEIIEDRHGKTSLIITSQLPVSKWHEVIGEKTIADAILDRIVHDAHRIELKGESMRKKRQLEPENSYQ
jgi:hypothetical protein